MSIFRDAKLKSDACSALHLESKSGGNAHGSIKSMAEFAPLVSLFCWWAPFSQCLCLTVSVCRLFFSCSFPVYKPLSLLLSGSIHVHQFVLQVDT